MTANIRSTLLDSPGGSPVVGAPVLVDQSRDDLRKGYQLLLESVNVATTYLWELVFLPSSPNETLSSAVFLAPEGTTSQTAKFNVDFEGSYLAKLRIDAGLPTDDSQTIRLRFVTRFGDVRLIAAGERRDATGVVPVDVSGYGWAPEQNLNIQRALAFVRRVSTSGRVLYVDANRGRDSSATPNDETNLVDFPGSDTVDLVTSGIQAGAEGFADFSTIQEAIDYADAAVGRGEPAPSATDPYLVFVQPGLYVEDVDFKAFIHVMGVNPLPVDFGPIETGAVVLRTANTGGTGTHTYSPSALTDTCQVQGIAFENTDSVTTAALFKQTHGSLFFNDCVLRQKGTGASQGPAFLQEHATNITIMFADRCSFISDATFDDDRYAIILDAIGFATLRHCRVTGRSGILVNPNLNVTGTTGLTVEQHSYIAVINGYGIRGAALNVRVFESWLDATGDLSKGIVLDGNGAGVGAFATSMTLRLGRSHITGQVTVDTDIAVGGAAVRADAVDFDSAITTPFIFPSTPPDFVTSTGSQTLFYAANFTDPETGVQLVPPSQALSALHVQNAIDELVVRTSTGVVVPVTAGPTYTVLSTDTYIGVDTDTPATTIGIILPNTTAGGAVDGRTITIKDEGGGVGVVGQEINVYAGGATSTIDGVVRAVGTPLVMNTNYESLTLICRGATGSTSTWFVIT